MKCKEILKKIEENYPLERAEAWDNPGLLVGNQEQEVKKIFLALDVTDETLEAAVQTEADLMITHHPLIFSGMKKITTEDFIGRRVIKLIENQISYYAMHTNFDIMGMAELSADYLQLSERKILETTYEEGTEKEGLGRYGQLPETMTLEECAGFVKQQFQLPFVKVYGNPKTRVSRAAICTGSGKSLIKAVLKSQAEVYITGYGLSFCHRRSGPGNLCDRCRTLRNRIYFYGVHEGRTAKKDTRGRSGNHAGGTSV